jgi:hypothetical protein
MLAQFGQALIAFALSKWYFGDGGFVAETLHCLFSF